MIGDYVYVQVSNDNDVVHLDRKCRKGLIIMSLEDLLLEQAAYRVSDVIYIYNNYDFCSYCISDNQMKQIEAMIQNVISNNEILYNELSDSENLGSFGKFLNDLEDKDIRHRMYELTKSNGDCYFEDYNKFEKYILGEKR